MIEPIDIQVFSGLLRQKKACAIVNLAVLSIDTVFSSGHFLNRIRQKMIDVSYTQRP